MICLLLIAAPPQIRVEAGKTIITQGGTTITLSADGGIKIIGPTLDLIVPGDGVAPPPPGPGPDALVDSIRSIYGGLLEPQKAADAATLARAYRAVTWDGLTTATIADQLRGKLPAGRIAPIRERIGAEVKAILGDDPGAPITDEVRTKGKALFGKIAATLEGLR
jgi:hypothetical protein